MEIGTSQEKSRRGLQTGGDRPTGLWVAEARRAGKGGGVSASKFRVPPEPRAQGCSPRRSVLQVRPRPARRRPSAPRSPVARRPARLRPAGEAAGSARGPFLPAAPLRPGDWDARSGPGSPAPTSGAPLSGDCEARGGWGGLGAASRCLFRACRTILA